MIVAKSNSIRVQKSSGFPFQPENSPPGLISVFEGTAVTCSCLHFLLVPAPPRPVRGSPSHSEEGSSVLGLDVFTSVGPNI